MKSLIIPKLDTHAQKENGRQYEAGEEGMRKEIFAKNWHLIQKHNQEFEQGKRTYKMAINKFADRVSGQPPIKSVRPD